MVGKQTFFRRQNNFAVGASLNAAAATVKVAYRPGSALTKRIGSAIAALS